MYGYHLPKGLQVNFAKVIQDISEEEGEVSPERVYDTFIDCILVTSRECCKD